MLVGRLRANRVVVIWAMTTTVFLVAALTQPGPAAASAGFEPAVAYPIANDDPWGLVSGDFNRDGLPDLAVSNFNGPSMVEVFRGTGGGQFASAGSYPVGGESESLAVGRLDAGSDLDIVSGTNNSLSLLVGAAGATFGPSVPFGAYPGQARGTGIADFNADGSADVVVSIDPNRLLFSPERATARSKAQQEYKLGTPALGLAVGRVNGDKRPDVVVASDRAKTGVVVLIARAGKRTFKKPRTFRAGVPASHVALGDLNGDGHTDVVVRWGRRRRGPHRRSASCSGASTEGSPSPASASFPVRQPSGLAVADVNLDGRQDALVADEHSGEVRILRGRGNGRFRKGRRSHSRAPTRAS